MKTRLVSRLIPAALLSFCVLQTPVLIGFCHGASQGAPAARQTIRVSTNSTAAYITKTMKPEVPAPIQNPQSKIQNPYPAIVPLALDPAKTYRVREINLAPGAKSALAIDGRRLTGAALMRDGFPSPLTRALESAIIELTAE